MGIEKQSKFSIHIKTDQEIEDYMLPRFSSPEQFACFENYTAVV